MTRNFPRWLSALTSNRTRSSLLGVGVLALLGVAAESIVTSATADLPVPAAVASTAPAVASAASGASTAWPASPASATRPTAAAPAWPAGTSADTPASAATSAWPASPTSTVKATPEVTTPSRPVAAPAAAPATGGFPTTAPKPATKPAPPPKPAPPAAMTLPHETVLQPNYYYCGPAATRIALTTHNQAVSFDALAAQLGTTPNGTNSAVDITRVLNARLGSRHYRTTSIPGKAATARQIEKLRTDVVNSIADGDPVVANIAGTLRDTAGERHSYEGGHYLTVVGYSEQGRTVTIADPADAVGSPEYRLSIADLANWIATRGYSS